MLVLFALLQFKLWFGDGGVREYRQIQRLVVAQQAENDELLARNKALAAEIHDLKNGHEAIEERARSELGLVGADEEFYQIVVTQR